MKKTIYVIVHRNLQEKWVIDTNCIKNVIQPDARFSRDEAIKFCKAENHRIGENIYSYRKATVEL